MKKISVLLSLLLILSLLLSSCVLPSDFAEDPRDDSPTEEAVTYAVKVSGEYSLFDRTPSIQNEAGVTVKFSLNIPSNGIPVAKLDGETLTPTVTSSRYRYSFVMPDHDVSLVISIGTRSEILNPGEVAITFVSLNDVHGAIEQDAYGKGGLSNTKVAIDKLSAFYQDSDPETDVRDDIVLFANGDMFQGSAISNMSRGKAVLDAMNAMEFDAMSLGNHEFDWGLDTVLAYWDGDESNGEADFPLVNTNIILDETGKKIADADENDNIVTSAVVEKMGVKIGLIGAIGPVENSILRTAVEPYTFADVVASVKAEALLLKASGVDLIAVTVHAGTTSGNVSEYDANVALAGLKDENGNYLVDLIFNGHTHYRQKGTITRVDGTSVPVVQAGANNECIGVITVVYNKGLQALLDFNYGYTSVSDVGILYDRAVEEVIASYSKDLIDNLPTLAVSDVTVEKKSDLALYLAEIMFKATEAGFSCSNYGGLRSTGGITKGTEITEANLYEIIPFDNAIYILTMPGIVIGRMIEENSENWFFGANNGLPKLDLIKYDASLYTIAVIDYVYTNRYFDPYRSSVVTAVNTQLVLRDLLIEDVKLYGDADEKWNYREGTKITSKMQ